MTPRSPSSSRPPFPAEAYSLGRWFTAARRQGLLSALAPDAWHTLSALLSFTCRDGARRFTLDQLALALGLSRDRARERLESLARLQWEGESLAVLEQAPGG